MEVKRYENDELHIVLKNPYCNNSHKSQHNTVTVDMNGSRLVWNIGYIDVGDEMCWWQV